jgi:hypothetical protein
MSMILGFLATTLGRWLAIAIGGVVLVGAFKMHEQSKGAAKERARIERAADENASKAEAARRAVSKLPVERLRDPYQRD